MNTEIATPPPIRTASGTLLVHAAFVLTGVMTTLLGPMLPVFSARWSLSDSQAGYLFTAHFAALVRNDSMSGSGGDRAGLHSHACRYKRKFLESGCVRQKDMEEPFRACSWSLVFHLRGY